MIYVIQILTSVHQTTLVVAAVPTCLVPTPVSVHPGTYLLAMDTLVMVGKIYINYNEQLDI